jgi:hypothetical protein
MKIRHCVETGDGNPCELMRNYSGASYLSFIHKKFQEGNEYLLQACLLSLENPDPLLQAACISLLQLALAHLLITSEENKAEEDHHCKIFCDHLRNRHVMYHMILVGLAWITQVYNLELRYRSVPETRSAHEQKICSIHLANCQLELMLHQILAETQAQRVTLKKQRRRECNKEICFCEFKRRTSYVRINAEEDPFTCRSYKSLATVVVVVSQGQLPASSFNQMRKSISQSSNKSRLCTRFKNSTAQWLFSVDCNEFPTEIKGLEARKVQRDRGRATIVAIQFRLKYLDLLDEQENGHRHE